MNARSFGIVPIVCAASALLGCDQTWPLPSAPYDSGLPLHYFNMSVHTPEGDTTRHILIAGQHGIALVEAMSGGMCGNDPYKYSCGFPLNVEFRSSDPDVVGPGSHTISGRAEVLIVAKAPGSVLLTARFRDSVRTARVDVVSSPLPVDSIRVRQWLLSGDSVLAAETDVVGNLLSLTMPTPDWHSYMAHVRVLAFRGSDSTVYLPMTIRSSDTTVATVWYLCRDLWVRRAACDTPGPVGVRAYASGIATVTISARGQQYAFRIRVQQP